MRELIAVVAAQLPQPCLRRRCLLIWALGCFVSIAASIVAAPAAQLPPATPPDVEMNSPAAVDAADAAAITADADVAAEITDNDDTLLITAELGALIQALQGHGDVDLTAPAVRRQAMQALLQTLLPAAHLLAVDAEIFSVLPATELGSVEAKPGFMHIYIPDLAETAMAAAKLINETVAAGNVRGLVIDFRATATVPGELPLIEQVAAAVLAAELPVVFLIDANTGTAAAAVIAKVKADGRAMTVGQKALHAPAAWRRHVLPSGDVLLLPEPVTGQPQHSLQPDVVVAVAAGTADVDTDPSLRRALDVLSAICAFDGKHF